MMRKIRGLFRNQAHDGRVATATAFLFCSLLSAVVIGVGIRHKIGLEKLTMERMIMEKRARITDTITKLLYKTEALAALVIQSNGKVEGFERVAATIVDDPAIQNILLAPNGVVADVYPRRGNTSVIGHNLLGPGAGNKEAILAKNTNELIFGGPFNLVQGGQAVVGRLPVYLDSGKKFWGLVSVTLKFPEVLAGAGLDSLAKQGLAYEIWRVNPDTDKKQIISGSNYDYDNNTPFIEKSMPILNADWRFKILPVQRWYESPENWALMAAGLFISLLVAFFVHNNHELKIVKNKLETMVLTDPLTGLPNRKGLFQEMERRIKAESEFHLAYIDLNYFKQINDTYGHNIGDFTLMEFARRVAKHLDDQWLFARISGDEFALIHQDDKGDANIRAFWREIDRELSFPVLNGQGGENFLSFSKGTAAFPRDGKTPDQLISCADRNMYEEKNSRYSREKRRRRSDSVG